MFCCFDTCLRASAEENINLEGCIHNLSPKEIEHNTVDPNKVALYGNRTQQTFDIQLHK